MSGIRSRSTSPPSPSTVRCRISSTSSTVTAAVPEVVGPDRDRDPLAAVLEAAGADDHHPVADAELLHPVLEAVVDLERAAGAQLGLAAVGRALVQADEDLDLGLRHGRILAEPRWNRPGSRRSHRSTHDPLPGQSRRAAAARARPTSTACASSPRGRGAGLVTSQSAADLARAGAPRRGGRRRAAARGRRRRHHAPRRPGARRHRLRPGRRPARQRQRPRRHAGPSRATWRWP